MAAEDELKKFIRACNQPEKVAVRYDALKGAERDFGLSTDDRILKFIANGGLEHPKHQNTETWRNNPRPQIPVSVYAFGFFAGQKYGYIAFMFVSYFKKWEIKSLKLNDKSDPRSTEFY